MRVKKFDPRSIKPHRIIFLIGKRHTGKSVCMLDILSKMPKPDFCLAFSPTDDSLESFKKFIPPTCIFSAFSHEKLERLLALQRELIQRGKTRSVLMIMDDCLYQKGVLKSTAMRDLFFNGRHLNVGLIVAAQYCMDIQPELRANIDYLFTMREATIINRQKLHKYFFGQFSKFDEFDNVMTACTINYAALVMDSTIPSTKKEDCVFWYRAPPSPSDFKLARPCIWKLSEKHMKSEEEVRKAQKIKFEMGNTCAASASTIQIVQTEDENGEIVNPS